MTIANNLAQLCLAVLVGFFPALPSICSCFEKASTHHCCDETSEKSSSHSCDTSAHLCFASKSSIDFLKTAQLSAIDSEYESSLIPSLLLFSNSFAIVSQNSSFALEYEAPSVPLTIPYTNSFPRAPPLSPK